MRYSRPALSALDNLKVATLDAENRIQTKMRPGESAIDCASRQEPADLISRLLIEAFVKAEAEVYALGSSGDCMEAEDLADIEVTIRQLFEDAAHKSWRQTRADARQPRHLEAAE